MATIEDWLEGHVNVIRRSAPNVFFECPSCGTRKLKCSINVHKGIGRCFRGSCELNNGFHFTKLIAIVENVSYYQAQRIALDYQEEIDFEYKTKNPLAPRDYPRNSLPLEDLLRLATDTNDQAKLSLVKHALTYLTEKRSLTVDQINEYQIGVGWEDYSILGSQQDLIEIPRYGMIILPIYFNQQLVSYTSRSLEVNGVQINKQKHHHPRTSEGYTTSGDVLFNADAAFPRAKETGKLVIVEDAWAAIKLCAVGTLGANLSENQLHLLALNYQGPIVVCRDNDKGGRTAAKIDLKKLSGFYSDVRLVFPSIVDPDDDLEETKRRIESSTPTNLFQTSLLYALTK